jgi:lysophospholipase L1-like esterase
MDLRIDRETFPQLERTIRFDVNTDGERGSEVRAGKEGLYRVLVAGGSPVESLFLDQATCWPGALERLLDTPENLRSLAARAVHVGGIGRSGIASEDLDLILQRVLPQYGRLNASLIMVGGNDVFNWLADSAPAVVRSSPIPLARVFAWHPEERFGWAPQRWGIGRILARFRRVWLRPREILERAGAWVADARKMRARAAEIRTSTPDPAEMLAHFEHHFRRIIQTAGEYSDRVLIVRQPWFEKDYTPEEVGHLWHGGAGDAWKEPITAYYSFEVVNRLMGLVDARAVEIANALGVEHLDIRAVLEPSLTNYYDSVHFTPAGSAVVARTVASALIARRPPSAASAGRSPPA